MKLRFRYVYMGIGSFLTIVLWLLVDPDAGLIQNLPFGSGTIATIVILLKSVFYVAMLHLSRKALFDYIDLYPVFKKAIVTSEGAANVLIAIAISMVAISIVIYAAVSN